MTRMRIRRWARALRSGGAVGLLVITLAVLSACGSAPPVPADNYYRLQAVPARDAFAQPLFKGVLEVDRFSADGLTAGRPIIYSDRDAPIQLREYHYHFWTQAPALMLRDELVNYLRVLKVADQVVSPEVRANPTYVLTARIKRLERIIGTPAAAVLEIEFAVRQEASNRLEFLQSYRAETTPQGSSVGSVVEALNEALSIVYADFVAGLENR